MDEDNGDDDEDSDDDSDLEIVISAKPGQRVEAPAAAKGSGLGPPSSSAVKITRPGTTPTAGAINIVAPKREPIVRPPEIELDAIALLDGRSIIEQNLEELDPKPWRAPGADISEYFNYGFDEFTWTAYCQKQRQLREDYEPGKVMASMMPDPMMGMMPPGMPGMPPMDPAQMAMMMGGMMPPVDHNSPVPSGFAPQAQQQAPPQQQQQYQAPRGPNNARHDNNNNGGAGRRRRH